MKLGIMQPYFFPYIGYFQLMNYVDEWIVFDEVQFIDKGWVNRNRILHPDPVKEWLYITVPLDKKGQFDKISEITIKKNSGWIDELMGKLTAYKKKAPFYKRTRDFVGDSLNIEESNLSQFLVTVLKNTTRALSIETPIKVQSSMKLPLSKIEHPGQWALRISQSLGANEYVNPCGGADIFDQNEFDQADIKLKFLRSNLSPYVQRKGSFTPGLSIIDVMMWNDETAIHEMLLKDFNILSKDKL